ncbi:MAG: asparagine synthase (glutamine-hydrolyzing) [Candidatus Lernaella stagnicola]|nr:asparagine synthase (glutamine-hydrolyzing) [Candidatus Lernaella stagnicola]
MCGIAGHWRRDGANADTARVERIGAAIAHRGPDAMGIHAAGPVCLLSQRFSLEDHDGGAQPASYRGITVVWNGEIFNWRELAFRHGLEEVSGDTVLLPRLLSHCGPEIIAEFNGQFAIAAWDERRRRLILARDAAGILPLLYRETPDEIVFASELCGMLADPQTPRELDEDAITYFLRMGFFPAPETPLANVRQLEPGAILTVRPDMLEKRFFGLPRFHPGFRGTLRDAASSLANLMHAAVSRRLSTESPDGLFLSGGVDSGLIAAVLRKMRVERPSYTVGFEGSGSTRDYHFKDSFERRSEVFSEADLADQTAESLGAPRPVHVTAGAAALTASFPEAVRRQDIPCMSISSPPLYFLTKRAAVDIRVALSGGGADELFAGYAHCDPRHYESGGSTIEKYLELVQVFSPEELAAIGSPLADRAKAVREAVHMQTTWAGNGVAEGLPFVLATERLGPLPQNILLKNDRIGMANPLEMRYPFLDSEIVAFAQRLPHHLLVGEGGGKLVVKEAAKLLGVPHEIAYRPKIRLQAPYATYLDDPAHADYFARLIADPPDFGRRLYDPEKAIALLFGPACRSVWRRPAKIMLLATWNLWLAGLT